MKRIILIAVVSVSLCSFSCDLSIFGGDNRLVFDNKSNNDLYYYLEFYYPDTTVIEHDPHFDSNPLDFIDKKSTKTISLSGTTWEYLFKKRIPSDTLQIFIYDVVTVENTPWEQVREEHMVLKRYVLSYQDLVDMDWMIEYEGEEEE